MIVNHGTIFYGVALIKELQMNPEESQVKKEYFSNVRRTKRLLRFFPRRANLDSYPVIRLFAATARKTPFLWSFKDGEVVSNRAGAAPKASLKSWIEESI